MSGAAGIVRAVTGPASPTSVPEPPFRCFGSGDPLYESYHDTEWGRPVRGDAAVFERLALEAFQSGLSWITVLRKREAFREVFAGFDPAVVAGFGAADVERLLADARIIRNRLKVEAAVANARAVLALAGRGGSVSDLLWAHAPQPPPPAPLTWSDVPAATPGSAALARALKAAGLRFVGPTTAYASMQACGVVNDHLAGCPARAAAGAP